MWENLFNLVIKKFSLISWRFSKKNMIHMELGPSTIVGLGLSIVGLLLYLIRTNKPNVSRDYDLFFSSVGLLCGGILIFQGWRLDPILLLCQILSSGTALFFIGESLWLRGANEKNKDVILSAKIVTHLPKEQDVPLCFLIVDFKYNFSVISLYHANKSFV